ncbi:MAG: hypothetical protein P9M00_11800, partial [Candidatus Tritonobacter lacicola]|nr:hypothetical protein [Candidatus Tritonobacter lacicola]
EPEYKAKVLAFYASPDFRKLILKVGFILTIVSFVSFSIASVANISNFSHLDLVLVSLLIGWFVAFLAIPFFIRVFIIPFWSMSSLPFAARYMSIFMESFGYLGLVVYCVYATLAPWGIVTN